MESDYKPSKNVLHPNSNELVQASEEYMKLSYNILKALIEVSKSIANSKHNSIFKIDAYINKKHINILSSYITIRIKTFKACILKKEKGNYLKRFASNNSCDGTPLIFLDKPKDSDDPILKIEKGSFRRVNTINSEKTEETSVKNISIDINYNKPNDYEGHGNN